MTIAAEKLVSCTWMGALLSSISSPCMSLVTLRLTSMVPFTTASQFKANVWESLDGILTSIIDRGIARRAVVQVLIARGDAGCGEIIALIESAFPRLKARGPVAAEFGCAPEGRSYGRGVY